MNTEKWFTDHAQLDDAGEGYTLGEHILPVYNKGVLICLVMGHTKKECMERANNIVANPQLLDSCKTAAYCLRSGSDALKQALTAIELAEIGRH